MTKIPLHNSDLFAVVDDEDASLVSGYRWYFTRGYAITFPAPSKSLSMQHLLLPPPEGLTTDHRDRDKLNNSRANLRIATRSQNQANRVSRTGVSRFKGVIASKTPGRWRAMIKIDNRKIALGTYTTQEDAARAYNRKAFETWGEYALLNEVKDWEKFEVQVSRWSGEKDRGIYWHKKARKWNPRVFRNGKIQHLGLFVSREEAVAVRKAYLESLSDEGTTDTPSDRL